MAKALHFLSKEQQYWEYRRAAALAVEDLMLRNKGLTISLTDITPPALGQAMQWRPHYALQPNKRIPTWNWVHLLQHYRRRPRRIELAIWLGPTVCGLLLGRVSERRVIASIHYLESNPVGNPLSGQVAEIAVRYLDAIAHLLGCKETAIANPIPELVDFYRQLGFAKSVCKRSKLVSLNKKL